MQTKVNYTFVGLFVVLLTTACIVAVIWLLGNTGKSYKKYVVYMHEAVSGLNIQAPVKFNGVEVGEVVEISLGYPNVKTVRLVLKIESNIPITEATYATLVAQGITGLTYVGLKAEDIDSPLVKIQKGEAYPVIKSTPSLLVQLDTLLNVMTQKFSKLSDHIDKLFNDDNYNLMHKNLENITHFTDMLSSNSKNISNLIQDSKQFSSNALKASEELIETANNLKELSEAVKSQPSIIFRNNNKTEPGPGE